MHVQEQGLHISCTFGAVRHQLGGRRISEEPRNRCGGPGEPQLWVERTVVNPAGLAHVIPGVLGGGRDTVLNVFRLLGAEPQVFQRYRHHEGVGVHHVRVGIAPGVIERVVGDLLQVAVLVPVQAHNREVDALRTVGDQHIVGTVVPVGVNIHGERVLC